MFRTESTSPRVAKHIREMRRVDVTRTKSGPKADAERASVRPTAGDYCAPGNEPDARRAGGAEGRPVAPEARATPRSLLLRPGGVAHVLRLRLDLRDQILEVRPAADGVEFPFLQFAGKCPAGRDCVREDGDGLVGEHVGLVLRHPRVRVRAWPDQKGQCPLEERVAAGGLLLLPACTMVGPDWNSFSASAGFPVRSARRRC